MTVAVAGWDSLMCV